MTPIRARVVAIALSMTIGAGSVGGADTIASKRMPDGGSSGFNAVLGGNRNADDGRYARLDAHGFYWTASETDPGNASFYNFGKGGQALYRQPQGEKRMAISVRCVKE
jgi:uncharacterized protein (TIGR02145 family)